MARPSLIHLTGSEARATAAVFSGPLDWPVPPAAWASGFRLNGSHGRVR